MHTALNDDGSYRNNIFYQTIGEAYIPIAFAAAAAAADPSTKLYYNDYSIEYAGSKATAAQNQAGAACSAAAQIAAGSTLRHSSARITALTARLISRFFMG